MRLIELFDKGAAIDPDRPFLVDDEVSRSYGEVQAFSHHFANACRRDGISPGVHAAVYGPNTARTFECVIGVVRAGCVWLPVNARNADEETIFVLKKLRAEVLFFSVRFADKVGKIAAAADIGRCVCIDGEVDGFPSLDRWIAGTAALSPAIVSSPLDTTCIITSGGTTGLPKGVVHSHLHWVFQYATTLVLTPADHPVFLAAAPITHAAGATILVMMAMGVTAVILPGFDADRVIDAIGRFGVTHSFLPPTAIYRLLAHPRVRAGDYRSLRCFLTAAAPIVPEKIIEAMDVFGPVVAQSYGGSEPGTGVTWTAPADYVAFRAANDTRRMATVGRETPFNRVAIMDDDGKLLPPETPGEIVIRGDASMKGYFENPEGTAAAFKHGWLHTGDIGIKDAEGWLYLVDRKNDLIITGGFNVFPAEIERVVLAHPAVQDCAVIGLSHPDWGEAITAVIELKPGRDAGVSEIEKLCREKLGGYKIPKAFHFINELPRSGVGKVLKRKLREQFAMPR